MSRYKSSGPVQNILPTRLFDDALRLEENEVRSWYHYVQHSPTLEIKKSSLYRCARAIERRNEVVKPL